MLSVSFKLCLITRIELLSTWSVAAAWFSSVRTETGCGQVEGRAWAWDTSLASQPHSSASAHEVSWRPGLGSLPPDSLATAITHDLLAPHWPTPAAPASHWSRPCRDVTGLALSLGRGLVLPSWFQSLARSLARGYKASAFHATCQLIGK